MAVFEETIKLKDEVSATAGKAAGAVSDLAAKTQNFGERMAALRAAKKPLTDLVSGTEDLGRAYTKVHKPLEDLTAKMLKSQANAKLIQAADAKIAKEKETELAKSTAIATKNAVENANKLSVLKDAAGAAAAGIKSAFSALASGDVIGVVSGLTDSLAGAAKALDLLVPGLGQVASLVIQVAGGAATVALKLVQFAIASTEAKTQSLALFDAMGSGLISGKEVDGMLDDLRDKLGITKEALGKFTTQFLKMGISSKAALEDLTTAAISAEALNKGVGGDAFVKLQKQIDASAESGIKLAIPLRKLTTQLSDVGLNAEDVAKVLGMATEDFQKGMKNGTIVAKDFGEALTTAVTKKGKGPLDAMSNSISNLGNLFKEYLGDIFEDMGAQIAPLMKEVKSFFETFSQAKPSGQAIKAGLVAGLTQVFSVLTVLVPMVKHLFLDMIIYSLKAYIAMMPIISWFKELGKNASVMAAVVTTFKAFGYVVLFVVGVIVVLAAIAVALFAAFLALPVAFLYAGTAIGEFLRGAAIALYEWVAGAATAAYNFVAGLVAGIAGGAASVIGAVTGLAGSATDAFKNALGIHSPSKVMMALGDHTGTGFALGLEDTSGDVHAAASGVSGAAVKGASNGDAASAGGGKSGGNVYNVNVQVDGAGKDADGITREMVSSVFESLALTAGL